MEILYIVLNNNTYHHCHTLVLIEANTLVSMLWRPSLGARTFKLQSLKPQNSCLPKEKPIRLLLTPPLQEEHQYTLIQNLPHKLKHVQKGLPSTYNYYEHTASRPNPPAYMVQIYLECLSGFCFFLLFCCNQNIYKHQTVGQVCYITTAHNFYKSDVTTML